MTEREETATGESDGPACEYVDFEGDSREACGDPAEWHSIKNIRVSLCIPHLEAVMRSEGLHPDARGEASSGRAA